MAQRPGADRLGRQAVGAPVLTVNDAITIPDEALEFQFIRASGPGGQNVNKVSTAVQLRFDPRAAGLPPWLLNRLRTFAGRRMNRDGVIVIDARNQRTQERNREDALERLAELIRQAADRPKPRKKSRPTLASKKRRLEGKKRDGEKKRLRRKPYE